MMLYKGTDQVMAAEKYKLQWLVKQGHPMASQTRKLEIRIGKDICYQAYCNVVVEC